MTDNITLDSGVGCLGLKRRTLNCLLKEGLLTIRAVREYPPDKFCGMANFGAKSYLDLRARLLYHGIFFRNKYFEMALGQTIDTNVERVREQLLERSKRGISKYGVTTNRTDLSMLNWLTHLQEELMDACVYIEAYKNAHQQKEKMSGAPAA